MSNIKGAGRKPLEDGSRREKNIRVRLSASEFELVQQLHRKTDQESISTLVRTVLFKERIRVSLVNKEVRWLTHDLSDLSKQIAKLLKAKSPKIESIEEKVIELERQLRAGLGLLENLAITMDDLEDSGI